MGGGKGLPVIVPPHGRGSGPPSSQAGEAEGRGGWGRVRSLGFSPPRPVGAGQEQEVKLQLHFPQNLYLRKSPSGNRSFV
jgi:hypothetical protein